MPGARSVCVLVATLAPLTLQGQAGSAQRSLPPPTDIDAQFTEQLGQAEQQFCKAILNKDARTLDSLVSPNFTLRVADVPQGSLPRTVWMDNTLHRITGEHCEQHHVVARKVAADLAAVSLVWTQKGTSDGRDFSGDFYVVDFWQKRRGNWQIIARYSTLLGTFPERPARQLPPVGDVDPDLTEHLRQLEQQFAEASMRGDTQVVDRLMGADFTLRVGDAPERSVPRALREDLRPQATRAYKMESFEERHHAARKLTNDLAVVSLLLSQKATFDGRDRSGDFYVVDVWRKTPGNWQIIARYSTPLGKKFDRSPSRLMNGALPCEQVVALASSNGPTSFHSRSRVNRRESCGAATQLYHPRYATATLPAAVHLGGSIRHVGRDRRTPSGLKNRAGRRTTEQSAGHPRVVAPADPGSISVNAFVIFAIAASVRVLNVWQMRGSPFGSMLMGDSATYDEWARRIAAGDWLGSSAFYQAPLYPYVLGTVYAVLGRHLFLVRVLQAVAGGVACVLLSLAVGHAFGRRAGFWAGLFLALYGEAIFLEGLIQKSVLDSLLICALVVQVLWLQSKPHWTRATAIGITIGLLCLTRENALVWIPLVLLWMVTLRPSDSIRVCAACAFGIVAVLGPVAARNHQMGGGWTPTTSQFGPNLYIGNSERATGTYVSLRREHGDAAFERQDATELAEAAVGHSLSPREVSTYWRSRAVSWIQDNPDRALRLFGFKLLLLVNGREAADTEDIATHAQWSWVLQITRHVCRFGTLLPLAILGAWLTRPRWRELWLFYSLVLVYAFSVASFYVLDRYRYPLVPLLCVFAGASVSSFVPWWSRASAREKGTAAAIVAIVATACAWPIPLLAEDTLKAATAYNLGIALEDEGKVDEAIAEYRRATSLAPEFAVARSNLGTLLASKGDRAGAIREYRDALRLDPDLTAAWVNIGIELARTGQYADAISALRQAEERDPRNAAAHYNLGLVLAAMRRTEEALAEFRTTLTLDPLNASAHNNIGILLASSGDMQNAINEFREALRLQPGNAEAKANLEHAEALTKSRQ